MKLYGGDSNQLSGGAAGWIRMGCFTGFFGLRTRSKPGVKCSDEAEQTEEADEIPGEKAVADNGDAATGYRTTTALELRRGATQTGEPTALGFDLDDLLRASAEVLGKGIFGSTYKANLEIGTPMVVKRLRDFSEKEFREMVDAIDHMNHQNLIPLTAYHCSNEEKLLVFDYMPMGSLYALLHVNGSDGRSPLNWDTRICIALGAARAIAYIHSLSPTAFHGNIKSSKILLTTTFEARVSDYGLAQYGPPHTSAFPRAVNLLDGYRAPEVVYTTKVSQKADVYSFGVLFFELLTGKDPAESYLKDEEMDLPTWILSAVNDEWTSEVFDVELLRHVNVQLLLQFLELAFIWTARNSDIRPSMAQVISQIENLCHSSSHVQGGGRWRPPPLLSGILNLQS